MCLTSNFGEVEFPHRKRFKADLLSALAQVRDGTVDFSNFEASDKGSVVLPMGAPEKDDVV